VANRKIKNATECELDGIKFRSKQERAVYKYLLSVGITPKYEAERFTIWDRDKFSVPFYDKYGKTFMRINRKPTAVHYTPDFIFNIGDTKVILEVKGFKNDAVPYKIRLFRDLLEKLKNDTGEKLCYAVVYTIKDLKFLLNDLQKSIVTPNFAKSN
jgi:Protein of unknown function (DUF1064).